MAFNYNTVDPKDMAAFQIIEPGEGTFKVVKCEDKQSRAGNDMMVVTYRIVDSRGRSTLYNDYLIASNDEVQNKSTATKIYNLLCGIGRSDLYGAPLGHEHILCGKGRCIIKTQKSDDPRYDDKSVISKFIYDEPGHESHDIDDTIPF